MQVFQIEAKVNEYETGTYDKTIGWVKNWRETTGFTTREEASFYLLAAEEKLKSLGYVPANKPVIKEYNGDYDLNLNTRYVLGLIPSATK